eukprot:603234-Rhodomonas_salina.1
MQDLTKSEKLTMLANNATVLPLVLHFEQHKVQKAPILILCGILVTAYSLLSGMLVAKERDYAPMSSDFNVSTTDASIIMLDILFWTMFSVAHLYLYMYMTEMLTLDTLFLYLIGVLLSTWAIANRILFRYLPSLVVAVLIFTIIHLSAFAQVMERDMDLWLPYFCVVGIDVMLLIGHIVDESLMMDVMLNCRLSIACLLSTLITATTIFIQ